MKRKYIRLLHTIFWSVTLISTGLETIPSFGKIPLNSIIWDYIIYAFSYILIFYLFYFFISNKYLKKEHVRNLIILGLFFISLYSLITSIIYSLIIFREIFSLNGNGFLKEISKLFFQFFETNFIFAISGSLMKIILLWFESMIKSKEAEKIKVKNDLALLKIQINPKFLINTLEDFKNLIEQSPEDAILIIENLSEVLSYTLYEKRKDFVSLEKEIKQIRNYLNLYEKKSKYPLIKFEIKGDELERLISPLMLINFTDTVFNFDIDFSRVRMINVNLITCKSSLEQEIEFLLKKSEDSIYIDKNVFEKTYGGRLNMLWKKEYSFTSECKKDKCNFKLKIE